MDPAGPCFDIEQTTDRLSNTDADFVDIIHTSSTLGLQSNIGHADFYPDEGKTQPGCQNVDSRSVGRKRRELKRSIITLLLCNKPVDFYTNATDERSLTKRFVDITNSFFVCSHGRAYLYYIESLTNSNCNFLSNKCSSWENYKKGRCYNCESNLMGFYSTKPVVNSYYYLSVNSQSNFCVTPTFTNSTSDNSYCSNSISIHKIGFNFYFIILAIIINKLGILV